MLKGLLDEVIEKYAVDANRVCVTGISMGGFGTWNLATTYPEYLAAAVPVAGGGNVKLAQRMAHLPIWVFHGAKDQAVNIKGDQDMVKALREYGSDVKFTVYPDADHRGTCVLAYNTQELYDWILKQRRGGRSCGLCSQGRAESQSDEQYCRSAQSNNLARCRAVRLREL